jgi:acyl-[acyl-carrier-protein] desaturase
MVHMTQGFENSFDVDMLHTVAYVSFQELATRISHRNTGRFSADPFCDQLLARIAVDENLHMVFYRNLMEKAFELAPDETMQAVWNVVSDFQMPGSTIEGFTRRSVQIAMAGIYDLRIHHDEVLMPVLRKWGVFEREGLSGEGEKARQQLAEFLQGLDAGAARFESKREAWRERQAARGKG